MKKLCSFLAASMILLTAAGCGQTDTGDAGNDTASESAESSGKQSKSVENGGFLPKRIEKTAEGGSIPSGSEAKQTAQQTDLMPEMFWGEWVLQSEPETKQSAELSDSTGKREVYCFPSAMQFSPAWAANLGAMGMFNVLDNAQKNLIVYNGMFSSAPKSVYPEPDAFGQAAETLGYYVGSAHYKNFFDEADSDVSPLLKLDASSDIRMIYTVDGDTLVLGMTTASVSEDIAETDITELDYGVQWDGYKLTLTYGSETADYVPKELSSGGTASEKIKLKYAGPVQDSQAFTGLSGISYQKDGGSASQIMRGVHEGYLDTDIQFNEDGSYSITLLDGSSLNGTYRYAGNTITLESSGESATYSNYSFAIQSCNATASMCFFDEDTQIRFNQSSTVKWLTEQGFKTDLSSDQSIQSCEVTQEIKMSKSGGEVIIRAINPYEKEIPLGDCLIAYVRIEKPDQGVKDGIGIIGQSTLKEIDYIYNAPYEKTDNLLRYKAHQDWISTTSPDSLDYLKNGLDDPHGKTLLVAEDVERIYDFEDGVLKDVRIEIPSLLYNGLQDNVDHSKLEGMGTSEMHAVIEKRDIVVHELSEAFGSTSISLSLNDSTGESVMDSSVLFATDSADLTPEGKAYLDDFIQVYASVLTSEENKQHISEVRFEGHTDSNGSYEYNLILSQKRADAVMNYCLSNSSLTEEQRSVMQSVSTAIGYSFSDPILDKDGKEDQAASRRAAVKFYVTT